MKGGNNKMAYNGHITWRRQSFNVTQLEKKEEIIGKWFVGLSFEGKEEDTNDKKFYSRVFTMAIKESMNLTKRPVLFNTSAECADFIDNFYFPKQVLNAVQVTDTLYERDIFPQRGGYLLVKSSIIIV